MPLRFAACSAISDIEGTVFCWPMNVFASSKKDTGVLEACSPRFAAVERMAPKAKREVKVPGCVV